MQSTFNKVFKTTQCLNSDKSVRRKPNHGAFTLCTARPYHIEMRCGIDALPNHACSFKEFMLGMPAPSCRSCIQALLM